ncbi:MAG: 2-hydroxychromene-2-carboxylate isomerase [Rhodoplanes sp.]
MTPATLYFDVVSPFAYLLDAMLRRTDLPLALERKPALLAGLLNAHGNKGPAEIPSKRTYIYEFCTYRAHVCGIPFQIPAVHPFNPLRYLRLIIALGSTPEVASAVFDALYATGADPDAPSTWRGLAQTLGLADPDALIEAPAVKQQLRDNTDAAVAAGVFGVPTILVGDRLFWGEDSLPMLSAYLAGDPVFDSPAMLAARTARYGARRRQTD